MAGITKDMLSDELQLILETACREGAPSTEQPVCHPDVRVTAQLTSQPVQVQVLPWRVANASAGDLLLTPGGLGGPIGRLLSTLQPPQYFSHMGIFLDDGVTVRHATQHGTRLEWRAHHDGADDESAPDPLPGPPPGSPPATATEGPSGASGWGIGAWISDIQAQLHQAPTAGWMPDALRYGWPGTVTQTVEEAYLLVTDKGHARREWLRWDAWTGKWFWVDALTFARVHFAELPAGLVTGDADPNAVPAVVVKPCRGRETTPVRAALHRMARAAEAIAGHYRFYGYSRADLLASDPSKQGPPVMERQVPHVAGECSGAPVKMADVTTTDPVVCSSFVWLAAQRANEAGAKQQPPLPQIVLDGRPSVDPGEPAEACLPAITRRPASAVVAPNTPDGLYLYGEAERRSSAEKFFDYLHGTVSDRLPTFLVEWFTDIADDVANQVCNAFASDDCSTGATDSEAWRDPGVGVAVSPDDILNAWREPRSANSEQVIGVYGYNEEAIVRPPCVDTNPPPPSTWQISQGSTSVEATVRLDGAPVPGAAQLRIGAAVIPINNGHGYAEVPSGVYWMKASWLHPTTRLLYESKGEPITLVEGSAAAPVVDLISPPESRRRLRTKVHMDLVNRYAIGSDWWGHPDFWLDDCFISADFVIDGTAPSDRVGTAVSVGGGREVDDWGMCEVVVAARMATAEESAVPFSLRVVVMTRLRDEDEKDGTDNAPPHWHEDVVIVPPTDQPTKPGAETVDDLVRSADAWPVRAHVHVSLFNDTAP